MLATIPDHVLDRVRGQIPVGRLGRPEEIARVVISWQLTSLLT
jgi:NAD(P)-dependent dehydrogenase (short-subunit alcohol dehydrogenase family)